MYLVGPPGPARVFGSTPSSCLQRSENLLRGAPRGQAPSPAHTLGPPPEAGLETAPPPVGPSGIGATAARRRGRSPPPLTPPPPEKPRGRAGGGQTARPGGGECVAAGRGVGWGGAGGTGGSGDAQDRGAARVRRPTCRAPPSAVREPGGSSSFGTPPGGPGGRQSRLVFQTRRIEAPGRRGTTQHGIGGEWHLGDAGPARLQTRGRGALRASRGRDLRAASPGATPAAGRPPGDGPTGSRQWAPARAWQRPAPLPRVCVANPPKHTAWEGGPDPTCCPSSCPRVAEST